jgi:hypothetical protein
MTTMPVPTAVPPIKRAAAITQRTTNTVMDRFPVGLSIMIMAMRRTLERDRCHGLFEASSG